MMVGEIKRQHVLAAINEYQEVGGEAFLDQYGFGKATKYELIVGTESYPSKAIFGVAHKFANGKALRKNDFSGGLALVVKRLEALGFEVRKPTRNPTWTEDELVLALQLYKTNPASPPGKESTKVGNLSEILNKMHAILGTNAGETLRNRNGVYMKMMNFRSIDPAFTSQGKAGMKAGGKLEKEVWSKFANDPVALKLEADRIRDAVEKADLKAIVELPNADEIEGEEGGVVMRLHKRYERDRSLVRQKVGAAKKADNLRCEVCEFDFEATFGELGDGYIEVHHLRPVHTLSKGSKTKLSDLALLCANCHRMAHRKRTPLSLDELRAARSGQNA